MNHHHSTPESSRYNMEKIFTDQEVFEQIKDKGRKAYIRSWKEFKEFIPNFNFEKCHPGEENIIK
jgi:hypothetical protein